MMEILHSYNTSILPNVSLPTAVLPPFHFSAGLFEVTVNGSQTVANYLRTEAFLT